MDKGPEVISRVYLITPTPVMLFDAPCSVMVAPGAVQEPHWQRLRRKETTTFDRFFIGHSEEHFARMVLFHPMLSFLREYVPQLFADEKHRRKHLRGLPLAVNQTMREKVSVSFSL